MMVFVSHMLPCFNKNDNLQLVADEKADGIKKVIFLSQSGWYRVAKYEHFDMGAVLGGQENSVMIMRLRFAILIKI